MQKVYNVTSLGEQQGIVHVKSGEVSLTNASSR